jgi:hypothetical protein
MSDGFAMYLPILIVIVESGAIYATGVLSILLAYLSGSNGQYAVLDAVSPIMVSFLGFDTGRLHNVFKGDCILPHHPANTLSNRRQVTYFTVP